VRFISGRAYRFDDPMPRPPRAMTCSSRIAAVTPLRRWTPHRAVGKSLLWPGVRHLCPAPWRWAGANRSWRTVTGSITELPAW